MSGRALVLGRGVSGEAAVRLLERRGKEVVVLDGDDPFPAGAFDFAVVSPGIALSHPWLRECASRGIEALSELQLGCTELKRQGWRLLAVTGSKGKSSVVKIVAEAICASAAQAVACGNYGRAVCDVALGGGCGWAVVEVSSFQLETTKLPPDTFEAAAVLNLAVLEMEKRFQQHVHGENWKYIYTERYRKSSISPSNSRFGLAGPAGKLIGGIKRIARHNKTLYGMLRMAKAALMHGPGYALRNRKTFF